MTNKFRFFSHNVALVSGGMWCALFGHRFFELEYGKINDHRLYCRRCTALAWRQTDDNED